jgi:hypothetical protein
MALAGCAPDPALARLENDTNQTVVLRLCDGGLCTDFHPPRYEVGPGESVEVNVSSRGAPSVYLVTSQAGNTGCLLIAVHGVGEVVAVPVSAQVPCSEDTPEEWPVRTDGP